MLITTNTSKTDLQRLQTEARTYGYSLNVNNVQWKDENTLKSINYTLYFDTESSIGQRSNIHDLNRFNSFIVYKVGERNQGGVVGMEITNDNIKSLIPDINKDEEEYIVLASFINEPMPFKEFMESKLLDANNDLFRKEKQWYKQFANDFESETTSNLYKVNGMNVVLAKAKEVYTQSEILNIQVTELDNELLFNLTIKKNIGYHMETQSGISLDKKNIKKNLVHAKQIFKTKLKESGLDQATYYLDGIETQMTIENIDTSIVKFITIENGNRFDDNGQHLGEELRVYFKSI